MLRTDPERVALLVDALDSGDFKQAFGSLGYVDVASDNSPIETNCCLGVACHVAMRNGVSVTTLVKYSRERAFDGSTTVLPDSVLQWYGFGVANPYVWLREEKDHPSRELYSATALNDSKLFSFKEIADAFRYTYLEGHEPTQEDMSRFRKNHLGDSDAVALARTRIDAIRFNKTEESA